MQGDSESKATNQNRRSVRTKPSTFVIGALTFLAFLATSGTFAITRWAERVEAKAPCSELPHRHEAEEAMQAHPTMLFHIRRVNPRTVTVQLSTSRCIGKAELAITYSSRRERDRIEDLLEGASEEQDEEESFYGIPVVFIRR